MSTTPTLDPHAQLRALYRSLLTKQEYFDEFKRLLALYEVQIRLVSGNPVVRLNHAVAYAMVHGPEAGLALLEPLRADPRLAETHRLDAVRAHLLERAGRCEDAAALYRSAASRTASAPERDYLVMRAARLSDG